MNDGYVAIYDSRLYTYVLLIQSTILSHVFLIQVLATSFLATNWFANEGYEGTKIIKKLMGDVI